MKKNSGSSQKLGSFLSPGAPSYREKSVESQKGWSSERMLQPASSSRRQSSVASSGLTPFNSGRTIPSKWDDAERWICSPVSSSYANNQHQLPQRPKSKSGPIVPPGAGYYSNYSPAIPLRRQSMVVKNLMMGSPFSTGVLAPDALSLHHYYAAHDTVFSPLYDDDDDIDNEIQYSSSELNQNGVALPSVSSAPMWSELLCDPSSPNFQGMQFLSKGSITKITFHISLKMLSMCQWINLSGYIILILTENTNSLLGNSKLIFHYARGPGRDRTHFADLM